MEKRFKVKLAIKLNILVYLSFRPTTPIRKSNEYINPRSSFISKKSRHEDGTHDYRVRNFRENHAAVVIQRGWRKHRRSRKYSPINKTKQDSFDKVLVLLFVIEF